MHSVLNCGEHARSDLSVSSAYAYPGFYNGGGSLGGGRARRSGGQKSPVGSRGKTPVGGLGDC